MYEPDAVIADEGSIADEPRRNAGRDGIGPQHRLDEVVVARQLVDEAAAVLVHRDQAGLGAVEQDVREVDLAVERARKIERVHRVVRIDRTTGRLSGLEAVAARACERGCVLDRRIRVVLLLHFCVGTKAAGREDHGAPRPDGLALVADINDGAFDAAVALDQLGQLRAVFNRHVALAQAVEEPRRPAHCPSPAACRA